MCQGKVGIDIHRCINICPICYVFTPENVIELLQGGRVTLGEVDLFVQVAQIGCGLCEKLCEVWDQSDIFEPGAMVSIRRQNHAPPGMLLAIMIEISDPLSKKTEVTGWYNEQMYRSWSMPLGIYTRGCNNGILDSILTLKAPNPSVRHDDVFSAFRTLLDICLDKHTKCKRPNPHELPARMLVLDDNDPDKLIVQPCRPGDRSHYIALSYCWGRTPQVKLLLSNLIEFASKGVKVSTLPQTLRDCVNVTRKLGIRHLWIDTLCIIQDSKRDQEREIINMARIYRNSALTISAAATNDCGQSFLDDRTEVQLRLDQSFCLPIAGEPSREGIRDVQDWIYLCPDPHVGHKIKLFPEEAINTRAWTYQESALAERLLIFGSGPPQWHCKENWVIYGLDVPPENLPSQECSSTLMKIVEQDGEISAERSKRFDERSDPPTDDIGLWRTWASILENYSLRSLSFQTDKLLALSALAAEYQTEVGKYAAGLWTTSLPNGFLWRLAQRSSDSPVDAYKAIHPSFWLRDRLFDTSASSISPQSPDWTYNYIAPTWSPMSCRRPICFESAANQQDDAYHTSLVEMHSIQMELTSTINPYGRLNFSYMDISAPMCSINWADLTANLVVVEDGNPFEFWDYVVFDDPAFLKSIQSKFKSTFNPQTLAGRKSAHHPIEEIEVSLKMTGEGSTLTQTIVPEPVSHDCPAATSSFNPNLGVWGALTRAISDEIVSPADTNISKDAGTQYNEDEFWLLEVQRSMNPAGLVLKQVQDDVFARVGLFAMNSCLDTESVTLANGLQVRGRKPWVKNGKRVNTRFTDQLELRRIYLV